MVSMNDLAVEYGSRLKSLLLEPVFFIEKVIGLELTPYQREWVELVDSHKRVNITAYRQSGKTEVLLVSYFIFRAFTKIGFSGVIVSDSLPQSTEVLKRIRERVLANEILRSSVPDNRSAVWNKTELELKNGSRILSKPYTDRIRGYTFDLVAADEAGMYKDQDIFLSAITPLVQVREDEEPDRNHARIIVVGTPTSQLDLLHVLRKNKEYESRVYPADLLVKSAGKTLWEMRYSNTTLEQKKLEIDNSVAFTREYLCKPLGSGDQLFPYERIEASFDPGRRFIDQPGKNCSYLLSLDFAMSGESGADYSVFMLFEREEWSGVVRIARVERYKGMSYQTQKMRIMQLSSVFKPYRVVADEGTFGKTFVQELRREHIPVTGINFHAKRMEMLEVLRAAFDSNFDGQNVLPFEERRFLIPKDRKCIRTNNMMQEFVKELMSFAIVFKKAGRGDDMTGAVKFEGQRAHDDIVMAAAMGYYSIREYGKVSYHVARGNAGLGYKSAILSRT